MSDAVKHECGIALLKLKKPLQFYYDKYGTSFYGLNKMYLLMEKQHNRGQDGAGLANIKFDIKPGHRYISRTRSNSSAPIKEIFSSIQSDFQKLEAEDPAKLKDPNWLKEHLPFTGELFLGHLRYGTFGRNSIESCHPFLRQNNWMTRNLVLAGNFNLTNVDELFGMLVELGQHPKEYADTVTVLEKIGHFLDVENEKLFEQYKAKGHPNTEISRMIANDMDLGRILKKASEDWDGGYVMAGLLGHGDAFVLRDPNGIRPCHYYENDEIAVVTSERPVIQTAFNAPLEDIKELDPGAAVILKKKGDLKIVQINPAKEKMSCSFERIYFSRASDSDIYRERKDLGNLLTDRVLASVNNDVDNTVFSFIPNTSEIAFYGMIKGLENQVVRNNIERLLSDSAEINKETLIKELSSKVRIEKVAIKDAKLRTFISSDEGRKDLVSHVYDITYNSIVPNQDNLVVIDDSIVRGTTLKESILRILDRLQPKKIVVVSSAPMICYPDCYGIDMARLGDFIAFQAAVELLKDKGKTHILEDTYRQCIQEVRLPKEQVTNRVKQIYAAHTQEEMETKISEILTPIGQKSEVQIIFQSVENLHKACPNSRGDWYFTGNYPTPGGNKVVNKAFINYFEGNNQRAY